jgi:hypothetical protein
MSDRDALIAEMSDLIEAELLSRVDPLSLAEREAARITAQIATWVSLQCNDIEANGSNDEGALHFIGNVDTLTNGLHALGTDRIAGTYAERVLTKAIPIQAAQLGMQLASRTSGSLH